MTGIFYLCSVLAVFVATVKTDLVDCPESGQSFHEHPTSCSQFIECRDGEQSIMDCMEDFHFDSTLGFCNFPEYVDCALKDEVQEEDDEKLVDCPEIGQVFIAHPSACDKFIECNGGEYREIDCIDGLLFNSILGFCDMPENTDCQLVDAEDEITDDNYGSGDDVEGDGEEEDTGDSGETDGEGETDNGEVDGEGENGEDNDVDGDGEGDDDGAVESGEDDNGNGNDDGQAGEDGEFACPASGQHWFPHPLNCNQFIECQNGLSTVVDCMGDFQFNPSLGWCDFPENVGCVDSTLPPITTTELPNDEGGPVGECPALNGQYVDFLTDSRYCAVFYKCNWGTPVQFTCQEPLHFNPELNVCDWPQNVGCTLE